MTPVADLRAVALEMVELDRRIARLTLLSAELRALPEADGYSAAEKADSARQILKWRWQERAAELLGAESYFEVQLKMTPADIRRRLAQLVAEHRAEYGRA